MKKKTALGVLAATAATVLALTGCAGGSTGSTASGGSGDKTLNIAFIPGITTDGFFVAMQHAAEAEAPKLDIKLDYTGPTTYSYAAQTQVFQAVLAKHPDGIIFASTDGKAMEAPVQQAVDAGIPVMTVDSTINNQKLLKARISTSDEVGGKLAADEMAKQVGDKGTVVVLGYIPGITTTDARTKAFIAQMKSAHPDIKVLDTQFSNGDLAKAASVTTSLVQANSDLKGIFVVNDLNAAGVINGLKSMGKTGDIKVVGYDAEPDEIGFLKDGTMQATVVQKPSEEAKVALQLMAKLLRDKKDPSPKTQMLDPIVATTDNYTDPKISQYFYK
jgi:ribose transport system substrate-binding protein